MCLPVEMRHQKPGVERKSHLVWKISSTRRDACGLSPGPGQISLRSTAGSSKFGAAGATSQEVSHPPPSHPSPRFSWTLAASVSSQMYLFEQSQLAPTHSGLKVTSRSTETSPYPTRSKPCAECGCAVLFHSIRSDEKKTQKTVPPFEPNVWLSVCI